MTWVKSSYSVESDCVEVAVVPEGVLVRDSKDPSGPALAFAASSWRAFVANPPLAVMSPAQGRGCK